MTKSEHEYQALRAGRIARRYVTMAGIYGEECIPLAGLMGKIAASHAMSYAALCACCDTPVEPNAMLCAACRIEAQEQIKVDDREPFTAGANYRAFLGEE